MGSHVGGLLVRQQPARDVWRELSIIFAKVVTDPFLGHTEITGKVCWGHRLAHVNRLVPSMPVAAFGRTHVRSPLGCEFVPGCGHDKIRVIPTVPRSPRFARGCQPFLQRTRPP